MIFMILLYSSIRSYSIILITAFLAQSEQNSTIIYRVYSTDFHIQQTVYYLSIF